MKSGIYQIINKINGHYYIGSAKHLAKRKSEHFIALKKRKHHSSPLQRAYNKSRNLIGGSKRYRTWIFKYADT